MKNNSQLVLRCFTEVEYGYGHVRFYPLVKLPDGKTQGLGFYNGESGIRLNDMQISDQIDDHNGSREGVKDYAWEVCFAVHRVALRDANEMAKTLKTIDRKLEVIREQFGYAATYGQFVARVAQAIGATAILFDSHHDGFEPLELKPGESVSKIDGMVEDIARKLRGESVEAVTA